MRKMNIVSSHPEGWSSKQEVSREAQLLPLKAQSRTSQGNYPQEIPVSVVRALMLCYRCLQVACVLLKEEMPPCRAAATAMGAVGCDIRSD